MNFVRGNGKVKFSIIKKMPVLTLVTMNLLFSHIATANSPFYPIPAYLSSKAETIRPNVMLFLDSSTSMFVGVNENEDLMPQSQLSQARCNTLSDCRLTQAQNAAENLVRANRDTVRWGFSTFFPRQFVPIGDDTVTIDRVIAQIRATAPDFGGTPTMPIFYQLMRYYQGLNGTTSSNASVQYYYGDWRNRVAAPSPIQYRCQKNFVIIISDGKANADVNTTERSGDPIFGSVTTGNLALPNYTKRAFEADFKTVGTDAEGQSWNDPSYPTQNVITYTIGFSAGAVGAAANLETAGIAGGGGYYQAADSARLVASLQDTIANIISAVRPPSPSTYADDGDGQVVGAISLNFKSANWSSDLTAFATNSNGSINTSMTKVVTLSKGAERNIWFRSNGGVTTKVAVDQVTADAFGVGLADATSTLVPWLRGNAVATGDKRASLFGDVINGNISVTNKGAMFVLGANDGMVHVFKKNAFDGYDETFVYMPTQAKRANNGSIGKEVPALTRSNYGQIANPHRYLVDGGSFYRGLSGVTLGDREFVVGATGRGAAGVYALDMKQIKTTNGNELSVLFDVTNGGTSDPAYRDMGYTVGTPLVAYVKESGGNKRWVAVAANGYFSKPNSTTAGIYSNARGKAGLYLINLDSAYTAGSMWQYLETPDPSDDNGLSSPTAVDTDNDGFVDYVYAGDLKGDLYRFSLKPDETNSNGIVKVFSGSADKPITSAPAVFTKKDGKRVIVFGTGRLLTESDNSNTDPQTVYGIIDLADDATSTTPPVTDTQLRAQSIASENAAGERKLSTYDLETTHQGWKLDLAVGRGERVVYQPVIYGNTVYLTTQIIVPPQAGLCSTGSGDGYIMSLDAETGGQPKARNSHFGDQKAVDYYAGKKVKGYVTNVGGLIIAKPSSMGTNTHGQVVAGMVNHNANVKSTSMGGGKEECKDTAPSVSFSDGAEKSEKVSAPACSRVGSNVRSLSWREIF